MKLWDKSRRIGATYTQAYEDVTDCIYGHTKEVWFSSSDEDAGKGYIEYCYQWSNLFNMAARWYEDEIIEGGRAVKVHQIRYKNGSKITALSSNPKALRSKGGKVILDEFAHHEQPKKLWAAAKACTLWGQPLRILSTQGDEFTLFYKFIRDIKRGKLHWSYHHCDLHEAIEDGLYDKIMNRRTTTAERSAWTEELRNESVSQEIFDSEFLCIPLRESSQFIDPNKYETCCSGGSLSPIGAKKAVGMDIARDHDLTVITVVSVTSEYFFLEEVIILHNTPFSEQERRLRQFLARADVDKFAGDATGIGRHLIENVQADFLHKVEMVQFTRTTKEHLAYRLKSCIEDHHIALPADGELKEDVLSIRRSRNSIESNSNKHHGDRFWSLALALYAARGVSPLLDIRGATMSPRGVNVMLEGY